LQPQRRGVTGKSPTDGQLPSEVPQVNDRHHSHAPAAGTTQQRAPAVGVDKIAHEQAGPGAYRQSDGELSCRTTRVAPTAASADNKAGAEPSEKTKQHPFAIGILRKDTHNVVGQECSTLVPARRQVEAGCGDPFDPPGFTTSLAVDYLYGLTGLQQRHDGLPTRDWCLSERRAGRGSDKTHHAAKKQSPRHE
jgi:hypothetical protein